MEMGNKNTKPTTSINNNTFTIMVDTFNGFVVFGPIFSSELNGCMARNMASLNKEW